MLSLIADQLHAIGFRGMNSRSLKPKHVEALLKQWRREDLSVGTLKNRMAAMRWWAQKVDRQNVIARSNTHFGIPERSFVSDGTKAKIIDESDLDKVRDPHVRMSLELQRAFGLRREEAIKFAPSYADQGDHLLLKPSWTKGGKARTIPVRTVEQREVLKRAHRFVGHGSLIPAERNYRQQLRVYERHTANAGLSRLHGLRHQYAQDRYEELTGWKAPAAGGPPARALGVEQRALDQQVRLIISQELGHIRAQIVKVYCR